MALTPYAGTATEHATIAIPDAFEQMNIADIAAALEALKDISKFNRAQFGKYRLVDVAIYNNNSPSTLATNDTDSYSGGTPITLWSGGSQPTILEDDLIICDARFKLTTNYASPGLVETAFYVGAYYSSVAYWGARSLQQNTIASSAVADAKDVSLHSAFFFTDVAEGTLIGALQCRWTTDPGSEYVWILSPANASVQIYREIV